MSSKCRCTAFIMCGEEKKKKKFSRVMMCGSSSTEVLKNRAQANACERSVTPRCSLDSRCTSPDLCVLLRMRRLSSSNRLRLHRMASCTIFPNKNSVSRVKCGVFEDLGANRFKRRHETHAHIHIHIQLHTLITHFLFSFNRTHTPHGVSLCAKIQAFDE